MKCSKSLNSADIYSAIYSRLYIILMNEISSALLQKMVIWKQRHLQNWINSDEKWETVEGEKLINR